MSRLFHFGALLAAALVLAPLASAQSGSSPNAARIQHVVVRGNGDAMEVEVLTSGTPVAPDTQAITGPDRIVVDFPGTLPAAELRALEVNRGALKRVRAGLFSNNPPTTRIVLDLAQPQSYIVSAVKNAVVIKLGQAGVADGRGQNPARTKVAQVNSRPANPVRVANSGPHSPEKQAAPAARLQNALLTAGTNESRGRGFYRNFSNSGAATSGGRRRSARSACDRVVRERDAEHSSRQIEPG